MLIDRHLLWECPLLGGHQVSVGEDTDLVLAPKTKCHRNNRRMRSVGTIDRAIEAEAKLGVNSIMEDENNPTSDVVIIQACPDDSAKRATSPVQ